MFAHNLFYRRVLIIFWRKNKQNEITKSCLYLPESCRKFEKWVSKVFRKVKNSRDKIEFSLEILQFFSSFMPIEWPKIEIFEKVKKKVKNDKQISLSATNTRFSQKNHFLDLFATKIRKNWSKNSESTIKDLSKLSKIATFWKSARL